MALFPHALLAATVVQIDQRAKDTKSDRVYVLKDGQPILNYTSGLHNEPIETMSATKSIVSLAIGFLIDDGYLQSLEVPVSEFYPEWKQGKKAQITIKHLLNHTSGIQANPNAEEIYASPDFVQLALSADLSDDPGTKFFYNNKAVNLLAGIIKRASGIRMDKYLNKKLFRKLNIPRTDWLWSLDNSGNPHGMSGLQITAPSLAKIGQMVLQKGSWNGQQIISEDWLDQSLAAGSPFFEGCGLLWWRRSNPVEDKLFYDDKLLAQYETVGISDVYVDKLRTIVGEIFTRTEIRPKLTELFGGELALAEFFSSTRSAGVPNANVLLGPARYFEADGHLGQYLVIIPEKNIVGVRQIHYQSAGDNTQFFDFGSMLLSLEN